MKSTKLSGVWGDRSYAPAGEIQLLTEVDKNFLIRFEGLKKCLQVREKASKSLKNIQKVTYADMILAGQVTSIRNL